MRVGGADEDVGARVAGDAEVAAAVEAELAGAGAGGHVELEGGDVGGGEEGVEDGPVEPAVEDVGV